VSSAAITPPATPPAMAPVEWVERREEPGEVIWPVGAPKEEEEEEVMDVLPAVGGDESSNV
jgi:hypothetical protein